MVYRYCQIMLLGRAGNGIFGMMVAKVVLKVLKMHKSNVQILACLYHRIMQEILVRNWLDLRKYNGSTTFSSTYQITKWVDNALFSGYHVDIICSMMAKTFQNWRCRNLTIVVIGCWWVLCEGFIYKVR